MKTKRLRKVENGTRVAYGVVGKVYHHDFLGTQIIPDDGSEEWYIDDEAKVIVLD
jgi:hypothetical protein